MCREMRDADVMFLGNHGVIVCGPTVSATFDDLYYLERACMLQVLAMGTGKPLRLVPDDIAAPVCHLLSDEAAYTTGHCMVIDGGLTL